jgi:uncharacterized phage-associated protein
MNIFEHKATEAAAFLLGKGGDQLEIKRLMKLLYLAERKSLEEYGDLLIGDTPCSFEQGPMLSHCYDMAKPNGPSAIWNAWISRRGMMVVLHSSEPFKYLSRADLDVLEETWAEFGGMSPNELTDYTHENCPEWTDPGKSSLPIEYWEFAAAVGYDEEAADIIGKKIIDQRKLSISHKSLAAKRKDA